MVARCCVLSALLLGTAVPALGQSSFNNPYKKLFKPRELKQVAQPPAQAVEAGRPRVVCGMTLIPVDPDTDPKFTKPIPDSATSYTMRVLRPPVCK